MTEHLPECPAGYVADLCTTDIDPVLQEPTCNHCVGQGCICICNRLRTCEQRVLAEREADGPWFRSVVHDCCVDKQTAYAAGLDAAREAVARLPEVAGWTGELAIIRKPIALAAIDALRRESDV